MNPIAASVISPAPTRRVRGWARSVREPVEGVVAVVAMGARLLVSGGRNVLVQAPEVRRVPHALQAGEPVVLGVAVRGPDALVPRTQEVDVRAAGGERLDGGVEVLCPPDLCGVVLG